MYVYARVHSFLSITDANMAEIVNVFLDRFRVSPDRQWILEHGPVDDRFFEALDRLRETLHASRTMLIGDTDKIEASLRPDSASSLVHLSSTRSAG